MNPAREGPPGKGVRRAGRSRTARTVVLAGALLACSRDSGPDDARTDFEEHAKTGAVSLTIVGDYFHHAYAPELAHIARALSPHVRQVFFCDARYERALQPLFEANGIRNVTFRVFDPAAVIMTQWARDIAVAGTRDGTTILVVSPDKHARSKEEAEATGVLLRAAFPDCTVRIAPFVFEGGNLAIVRTGAGRTMIVGRKVMHDNTVYQKHPWAAGYDDASLPAAMAETFGVDRVLVVGRETERPDTRMYFEYHIDRSATGS